MTIFPGKGTGFEGIGKEMQNHFVILVIALQLFQFSCQVRTSGCTDPRAENYDPSATENNGSCTYEPTMIIPESSTPLDPVLFETSGLIVWEDLVWTHNDDTDTKLYGLDPVTGKVVKEYSLNGVDNNDWEELAQDEQYLYLGDFGNNASGNRTDLHILRIEKNSLKAGNAVIDTIWFSYSDQTDFSLQQANMTDFDCEAMFVTEESIFLLTKRWISAGTAIYSLAKEPGIHKATFKDWYYFPGFVTGASYVESKQLIVLTAYTSLIDPFFYILSDFSGRDFFSGNKRKINMALPFHQVEGIATADGLRYYVSNEKGSIKPLQQKTQSMHVFGLSPYL